MKTLLLILGALFFTFIFAACRKTTPPGPDDFYFRCKIDGRLYIPNSCANCITCTILGDTTFLLGGNAGYESVTMGIIKLDNNPITTTIYSLNNNLQQNGFYDNSTLVVDIFKTDILHTGQLQITALDKTKRIIQGTFYFKAYNAYRNDSVNVTDGKFRLKYTID